MSLCGRPGCAFSEKLVLEKGKIATIHFTTLIQVSFKINKGIKRSENKKEIDKDLLS